ncbi:alpha/beta hydrolase [Bradyrhizobium liaoningense]|uniref:alpha/beta hydrolase n=1 Tax=Bradyrhizobium liaoningense TaxID=43992 RepID=UPI001BA7EBEB|nr:alpha/beta hydrolase [Bradyrhizobium liaoningense]MBR0713906.1 alpha/beta hydrolase [Bradyrhizobium liaoningense]
MALDQHVSELLAFLQQAGAKSFELMDIQEFRGAVGSAVGTQKPPQDVAKVHSVDIPGPAGTLQARIYVPRGQLPLSVVVYFHGGGWVGGGLDVVDEPCRALANKAGAIVVASSYRLAPENKFPSALDDAFAALTWVAQHIARFGGNVDKLFVAGDSAGGNLAAATALIARDRGGPKLAGQILLYPVVDAKSDYPSMREHAEGYFLHTAALSWFWEHYLSAAEDRNNPYASPIAGNLAGLPRTLIVTMEYDPSRDEGEAYGAKLAAAGVDVRAVRMDGLIHGTFWSSGAVPRAEELYDEVANFLRSQPG